MKQKVSVHAVIKQEGKVLLLRRKGGRPSIQGKYELLGGGVAFGEQPDDALRRYASEQINVDLSTIQIDDAVGYIDPDYEFTQYIVIVFSASIKQGEKIELTGSYDKYLWRKLSELQHSELTHLTSLLLKHEVGEILADGRRDAVFTTDDDTVIVYSDGGSRGNPGPSASGYVIFNSSEDILDEGGSYLGITTNNQAEYQGVLTGLRKAKELGARQVDFRSDSMLIVNQMNGTYKVKNRDLWPIYERIKELITTFDKVTFTHVRREFNKRADAMVNKILDEHAAN